MYKIDIYTGGEVAKYIDIVSELRLKIFREYPYLYEGNIEYERDYMACYARDNRTSFVIASSLKGEIVGISTGIPLDSDSPIVAELKEKFDRNNLELSRYYYLGEVIVVPEHRGLQLTKRLWDAHIAFLIDSKYANVTLLTVKREQDHPLHPMNYRNLDNLLRRIGFSKNSIKISYSWPTIQADEKVIEMENEMECWVKSLIQ